MKALKLKFKLGSDLWTLCDLYKSSPKKWVPDGPYKFVGVVIRLHEKKLSYLLRYKDSMNTDDYDCYESELFKTRKEAKAESDRRNSK